MGNMTKWRRSQAPQQKAASTSEALPMRMCVEKVSPELALKMLAVNQSNRPVSEELVKRYAADMKRGDWKTTHQGIAFDRAGILLDGQHRLRAIARAGITVGIVVFRDCDRQSFDRLDTGKKRTVSDALAIDGMDSARVVAAIARSLITFGFKESNVSDSFVVEFARERRDELLQYVQLVPSLTAAGAAAFVFAATDARLRPTVQRLLSDPDGQEIGDLRRCMKLMSANSGHTSQRARYALAMETINRATGRIR